MNTLKHLALASAAVLTATVAFTLVAPKAVHAVVSTLVTVTNTITNPVLNRDIDRPASEPFAYSLCAGTSNQPFPCIYGAVQPSSFTIPSTTADGRTVKNYVIEYVDGSCTVPPPSPQLFVGVYLETFTSANGSSSQYNTSHAFNLVSDPSITASNQETILTWAGPTKIYADAGTQVSFEPLANEGVAYSCTINVSGYLSTQ